MATTRLPQRPKNGQSFIDVFRVKWIYDGQNNSWERVGTVPEIPVATEESPGLLSANLKSLIDGIPDKGGHFGIIIKPLLAAVPRNQRPIHKDAVRLSYTTLAGSTILSDYALETDALKENEFRNKILIFINGRLKNEVYLITGNSTSEFYLLDDAGDSVLGDKFEIYEIDTFNPSGVLSGNIELVSDSLDITCINANGDPIDAINGKQCLQCDSSDDSAVAGFDLKISDSFIDSFCVEIPGCEGPVGIKGEKGSTGDDGTGDGPQGEQGEPGIDASATPVEFTGIKIEDSDEIFDTAVVELELDADNNLIQVSKAKIQVPDDDSLVNQLITTPVIRSLEFTKSEFEYIIKLPSNDPIGTADVKVGHYPSNNSTSTSIVPQESQVGVINLSTLIDQAIEIYNKKIDEISDQWDREIRTEVESKDAEARTILAEIAQKVNDCEWSQPIIYCMGIAPDDCNTAGDMGTFPFPLAEVLGGAAFAGATCTDLGLIQIEPAKQTPVIYNRNVPSSALPNCSAYLIQYINGAFKTNAGYSVGNTANDGTTIQLLVTDPDGSQQTVNFPVPESVFNQNSKESVIDAYLSAPIQDRALFIQFPPLCDLTPGEIMVQSIIPEDTTATGVITLRAFQVNRKFFEGTTPNTITRGASPDDVVITILQTAQECELFSVQVVVVFGTSVISGTITTALGDTIPGDIQPISIAGSNAAAIISFGILPVGSQGDAVIAIAVNQSGVTETNIPVTIGTRVEVQLR